jgi:hypothetical protein
MEEEDFYKIVNIAKGLCHVKIDPPEFEGDDMEIEFLEGPLEGMYAKVNNFNLK